MKYHNFINTFHGEEISEYGKENGRVDYATFSRTFDAVLSNDILRVYPEAWEQENGPNVYEIESELQNEIDELEYELGNAEENGEDELAETIRDQIEDRMNQINDLDYEYEIFQYFIVDSLGAELIKEYTDDPLFYNSELNMYVWGITHCGTRWDYVLTKIPCEKK